MRTALAAGGAYFLVVFGCGFVLGLGRTLWLVPRLGVRWAELIEMPVMLVVIYVAARSVSRRFSLLVQAAGVRIAAGAVGLILLVAAELGLVRLQGLSFSDYVAGRDPVSGSVYALSLLLFAAMPALLARRIGAAQVSIPEARAGGSDPGGGG